MRAEAAVDPSPTPSVGRPLRAETMAGWGWSQPAAARRGECERPAVCAKLAGAMQPIPGPAGGVRAAWVCVKLAGAMQPIEALLASGLEPRAPAGRPRQPNLILGRPLMSGNYGKLEEVASQAASKQALAHPGNLP